MFFHLPPVGEPVVSSGCKADLSGFDALIAPYQRYFYASGTAALAAAVLAACRRRADITQPEVLLPAYACPDLLSAVLYAGARPVLVDLAPGRPWLDLDRLGETLSGNTVAVIAVNFLGIEERHDAIRRLVGAVDALLIEDSAQSFPAKPDSHDWQGDLVVLSFGRGKPVSLLGGGALLYRKSLGGFIERPPQQQRSTGEAVKFRLTALVYNQFIQPQWYWLPESLPFLRLGETVFHPLEAIAGISATRLACLQDSVHSYQTRSRGIREILAAVLAPLHEQGLLIDLVRGCDLDADRPLLRYPLLLPPESRDKALFALARAGLGVSRFYPGALPSLSGVDKIAEIQGDFPQAELFARRLLTLPSHNRVTVRHVEAMRSIIDNIIITC